MRYESDEFPKVRPFYSRTTGFCRGNCWRAGLGVVSPHPVVPLASDLAVDLDPLGHVAERIDVDRHPHRHRPRQPDTRCNDQAAVGGPDALPIRTMSVVGG